MNTKAPARHVIDLLFVLALFALFAFCGIALIITGASVYEKNTTRMEDNYALRTAGAYLTEKVRRTDEAGRMEIGSIDGIDALLLSEEIDGISYTTYLYLYDGHLTELFARSDLVLPASAGTQVLPVAEVSFAFESDHLLRVHLIETNGRSHELMLSKKTETEAADE